MTTVRAVGDVREYGPAHDASPDCFEEGLGRIIEWYRNGLLKRSALATQAS